MSNDIKTLENAQPGGRVRLNREPRAHRWDDVGERCLDCGDKDWMGGPCSGPHHPSPGSKGGAWAIELARESALGHCNDHAYLPQTGEETNSWQPHDWVVAAIQTALLSAQPSPSGQDVLDCIGRIEEAIEFRVPHDIYAAVHGELAELKAALAARQPVGEPLWCMHILGPDDVHAAPSKAHAEKAAAALNAFHAAREEQSEHDPKVEAVVAPWPHSAESHAESVADFIPGWLLPRWQVEAIQTDATPTAQAVDLPYSLDADPAGIRARVADVITGTLMVGAQGHTPPPAGHWAEPFWKAARADATAQAVDLERARDEGHDGAIRYVLGYLNGTGDCGSTVYDEILNACGRERIIRSAVEDGELEFTGLGRWVEMYGTAEDRALIDGKAVGNG